MSGSRDHVVWWCGLLLESEEGPEYIVGLWGGVWSGFIDSIASVCG